MILELGDSDVRVGNKPIDPCLKCYTGAFFMCLDNENIAEDGTANGTQGRLKSVKLKSDAKSLQWKNWNGRKVWTVCATDVEWIELEHHPKTPEILMLEQNFNSLQHKDQIHNKQNQHSMLQFKEEPSEFFPRLSQRCMSRLALTTKSKKSKKWHVESLKFP